MSFLNKLSALTPFSKKEEELEYYFALNIGVEKLSVALWTIEGKHLKILSTAADVYSSLDEIIPVTDKILDAVLGIREIDVSKILFGVPHSWLLDDNLKDEYLKILRKLVKDLELTPMAYVSEANALINYLEKVDGIPPTAILAGFEKEHLSVTVVRAGKLDGVKIVKRGEVSGADLEKALLTFTNIETLPSKILIYDHSTSLEKLRTQLLGYSWMSNLSFLHFPKIEILGEDLEIKSICLAGASEIQTDVLYSDQQIQKTEEKPVDILSEEPTQKEESEISELAGKDNSSPEPNLSEVEGDNFGFVTGDVSEQLPKEDKESSEVDSAENEEEGMEETALGASAGYALETEDFGKETEEAPSLVQEKVTKKINLKKFIPKKLVKSPLLLGVVIILLILLGLYIYIPKASVKIFVEPKILEKDAQVIADPTQKTVDENAKIIPGQIVQTEVNGSAKDQATGKKEIGDSAKGTVIIYNKTSDSKSLSRGTVITSSNGLKFSLDTAVNIASQSATDSGITFGKANVNVSASAIGPDSNLPSGSELAVAGFSSSQVSAKAEGNFSGGTSKTVTVVSSDDQKRLLAKLSSDLRQQAQQKLQEKLKDQKILQEALTETIVKKSYNKAVGDQASEFSLNLTADYKGTAYNDADLRLIVSKLVTTQVPDGYVLDISATETQADVSSVDKTGKVVFLAKFKAKLMPKIDTEKVKSDILGKAVSSVQDQIKGMENVLGSEIKISPSLPSFLQRIPFLKNHIMVEVGLK